MDWNELWAFRELLYFLLWRDLKIRYRETVMGVTWAILQPVLVMAVFSLVLGRFVHVPSDGLPYPLFSFAGLVPWITFSNTVGNSAVCLTSETQLIKKVYFPRIILPTVAVLNGIIDIALAFAVLLIMMTAYGVSPSIRVLCIPGLILLGVGVALGVGLWLAALNARFRDVRHAVPFLVQIWMFATPILYPSSVLSTEWLTIMWLNPMATVVEGFRWALLGSSAAHQSMFWISGLVTAILLVSGVHFFRRTERILADVL